MALVRIEHRENTAVVILARPPANAFNLEFTQEFHGRLDELSGSVPSGGIVVTGDGKAFSGGVDFKAVPAYTEKQRAEMIGHINASMTTLYAFPTATVAAVNGHAIGGAFVLMLACDVRLAARGEAKLGLTEVTAGIPYPACPMEVVKAEVEPSYRRHLVLSGEIIGVEAAHAHGLVDEIVAPDVLVSRAVELARSRSRSPSYARVKAQLRQITLARMRGIIEAGSDPMLKQWV